MFTKTTHGISITATPHFLSDHSEPEDHHFVWAYTIELENKGDETVQLMNRYWRITDDIGQTQEVRGPGVIGEQPVLKPGESFRYTSGTALATPSGMMLGAYEMSTPVGERFEVEIPAFSLDSPYISGKAN
jgi:ApaG protein